MRVRDYKFPKKNLVLILIFVILSVNIFVNYENLNLVYKHNTEQIETIFFIHDNIPENSKILVPYVGNRTYLYELLIGYEYMIYNPKQEYVYYYIKGILISMNLKYLVVDISIIAPFQLDLFIHDVHFEILYKNDLNVVFKYNN